MYSILNILYLTLTASVITKLVVYVTINYLTCIEEYCRDFVDHYDDQQNLDNILNKLLHILRV